MNPGSVPNKSNYKKRALTQVEAHPDISCCLGLIYWVNCTNVAIRQNLIPSYPWIVPEWKVGGVQSKERKGSNFAAQHSGAIVQKPEGPNTYDSKKSGFSYLATMVTIGEGGLRRVKRFPGGCCCHSCSQGSLLLLLLRLR